MNGFWKTPIHSCRINWKCSFPTMPTPWIFQHWAVKISTLYKIKMSAVLADLPVAWLKSTGWSSSVTSHIFWSWMTTWPLNRNPCSVLVHFSCRKAQYQHLFIGGAMLRLDTQCIQTEAGAVWNGGELISWSMVWICGNWMPACTTNWKKKHSSTLGGTVFSRLKS